MLSACPRHKHYGTKVVHYAAASAVCHIHKGAECRKDIMDKLSIPGGTHTSHAFRLKDNKHLQKADTEATAYSKEKETLPGSPTCLHTMKFMGTTQGMLQKGIIFGKKLSLKFSNTLFQELE